jgi:hypothetical protein
MADGETTKREVPTLREAEIRAVAQELVGVGMSIGAEPSTAEQHYTEAERLTNRLIELCR